MPGIGGSALVSPSSVSAIDLGCPGRLMISARAANHRHLARQNRGGHEAQRHLAHLLAEARHHAIGHCQRRLGRDVAHRWAGAAGGQHQIAAQAIDQLAQRIADLRLLVGDQASLPWHRVAQRALQPLLQRRQCPCPRRRRPRRGRSPRPIRCAPGRDRSSWSQLRATLSLTNWNSSRQARPWRCPGGSAPSRRAASTSARRRWASLSGCALRPASHGRRRR